MLEDYVAYCDAIFRDADDELSLSDFVNDSTYGSKMDRRGSVAQSAIELFEEVMRLVEQADPRAGS